jgi:hypothetical protein
MAATAVSEQRISEHTVDLTIESPALGGPAPFGC